MKYNVKLDKISIKDKDMSLEISGEIISDDMGLNSKPKLIMFFKKDDEDRRIPFVLKTVSYINDTCFFKGKYIYKLDHIFWDNRDQISSFNLSFNLKFGNEIIENIDLSFDEDNITVDSEAYSLEQQNNTIFFYKENITVKKSFIKTMLKLVRTILYIPFYLLVIIIFFIEAILSMFHLADTPYKKKTYNPIRRIIAHINIRLKQINRKQFQLNKFKSFAINCICKIISKNKIVNNRVTFISARSNEITGNFKFVYKKMKDNKDLDIKFYLNSKVPSGYTIKEFISFYKACSTSSVIVLEEFTPLIHKVKIKEEVKIVQLWHACGAFKTFGFTRLGKPKGSPQVTKMHRNYDYVTVSSTYCKQCHSEGFGISTDKVLPIGIPRTDIFFDEQYIKQTRDDFYSKYPNFENKKIIMFAPTFRGHVKETANYPVEQFDIENLLSKIGDDYAVIIKHHPFVKEIQPIPEQYSDRVIDLSVGIDINDLLFVTDIIISDYSSLIFEASLLKIPMIFYAYDLNTYIEERDFYFDYALNVPGKIVYTMDEIISTIIDEDFQTERTDAFRNMFFDHFDGKSSQRVADLITGLVKEN